MIYRYLFAVVFFFFNDTATTEIYTLSLHDALPISAFFPICLIPNPKISLSNELLDRKSTRLNSSHQIISYAVFCLKKKKKGEIRKRGNAKPKRGGEESTAGEGR